MRTKYHQITLKDTFSHCQEMFQEDTPSFFMLLGDTLDISEFIPADFYHAFYHTLGRKRLYPLEGFLSSLILHIKEQSLIQKQPSKLEGCFCIYARKA